MKILDNTWHIYIIKCINSMNKSFLYTGISNRVETRISNHKNGKGAKFTRSMQEISLVFKSELGYDKSKASKIERYVKRLPKAKKEQIIKGSLKLPL